MDRHIFITLRLLSLVLVAILSYSPSMFGMDLEMWIFFSSVLLDSSDCLLSLRIKGFRVEIILPRVAARTKSNGNRIRTEGPRKSLAPSSQRPKTSKFQLPIIVGDITGLRHHIFSLKASIIV